MFVKHACLYDGFSILLLKLSSFQKKKKKKELKANSQSCFYFHEVLRYIYNEGKHFMNPFQNSSHLHKPLSILHQSLAAFAPPPQTSNALYLGLVHCRFLNLYCCSNIRWKLGLSNWWIPLSIHLMKFIAYLLFLA